MGNATKRKIKEVFWCKIIYAILLLIVITQPLSILYRQKESFFARGYASQYDLLKKHYEGSQYVQKINPGIMPDETLESFAGGAFLRGINPISIIHDQPPLGRYMLSLSILLFDNPTTIMVLLFSLSGLGVFLIARLVLKNALLAVLPFGIFINEPLFLNKFYYSPLLEPIQLPFIIFALYFFIQGIIKKNYGKWFVLTSIMLGFVISIRFFVLGAVLVTAMFLYFLVGKKIDRKFIIFLLTLPIAVAILVVSYAKTIQLGSSILHVFGIQKYIYNYHKAQLSLPFSFWDLLIFNRWHTWWGTRAIASDPQWIIFWPVSMIVALIYIVTGIFRKISISEPEKVLMIWILAYSLFLSLGETSTRYFPPLLPFIYILATSFFVKIVVKFKSKTRIA